MPKDGIPESPRPGPLFGLAITHYQQKARPDAALRGA